MKNKIAFHVPSGVKNVVLPPGFEPESLARKARMIGRTTLREPKRRLIIMLFQLFSGKDLLPLSNIHHETNCDCHSWVKDTSVLAQVHKICVPDDLELLSDHPHGLALHLDEVLHGKEF